MEHEQRDSATSTKFVTPNTRTEEVRDEKCKAQKILSKIKTHTKNKPRLSPELKTKLKNTLNWRLK